MRNIAELWTKEQLKKFDVRCPENDSEVRKDTKCAFCGGHYNSRKFFQCPICRSMDFLLSVYGDKKCDHPTGIHDIDHEHPDGPMCKNCGEKHVVIPLSTFKRIRNDLPYKSDYNPDSLAEN